MILGLAIYVGSSLFNWVDSSQVEPAFQEWQSARSKSALEEGVGRST